MKIIAGISPEDSKADIVEAYGRDVFDQMFPECDECGEQRGHDEDCSLRERNGL